MDENNPGEKKREESAKRLADEYLEQASYLGTILPLLDIFYVTVLEKQIKKYDLNIVKEFWIYFGLLVFSIIFFFDPFKFETIIFLFFATLITLILYNQIFFKKRIIPDDREEISTFIADIEKKSSIEIIDFIRQYHRKLQESEIIAIIDSTAGKSGTVYDFLKNCNISSKIVIHIVKTNRFNVIGEDLFKQLLRKFKMGMIYDNFNFLSLHFKENKGIIRILNLYNPKYSKKTSIIQYLANKAQAFQFSINKGKISNFLNIALLALVSAVGITGFNQIAIPYLKMEPYVSYPFIFVINYLFALAFTFLIVSLIISFFLNVLANFFWSILEFFTPDEIQI
jgi:hypothetical protein